MSPDTIELTSFTGRSYSMMLVFSALLNEEPMTGYSLLKHIEQSSDGEISFSAGAIYPQIDEYVETGYVTRTLETKVSKSSGRSREIAVFSLTSKGVKMLQKLQDQWHQLVRITDDFLSNSNELPEEHL